jgi:hypothetical protein
MMKTCNKCHVEKQDNEFYAEKRVSDGLLGHCKACEAIRSKEKYLRNKETIIVRSKAWALAHPDKERARHIAYRAKNAEKVNANKRRYNAENREKIRAQEVARYARDIVKSRQKVTKWRESNRDKCRTASRNWRMNNLESHCISEKNRIARKKNCGGVLSKGLGKKLFDMQRGKCACCGLPLGNDYHLDHVMPLALGGSNTDNNIQLLRKECNLTKSAKHPVDFMQQRGFLL